MKLYCAFIFVLLSYTASGQSSSSSKYIVVTLERTRTNDNHGVENAYWIVCTDSLKALKDSFAPLYMDGFSLNNFKECCGKGSITIFYQTDSTSYEFDDEYSIVKKSFSELIRARRKKVQTITKEWTKGIKETIKVYLTPVSGDFCYCRVDKEGSKKIEYEGLIAIPRSTFAFEDNFWGSEESSSVRFFDFSTLAFLNLHSIL